MLAVFAKKKSLYYSGYFSYFSCILNIRTCFRKSLLQGCGTTKDSLAGLCHPLTQGISGMTRTGPLSYSQIKAKRGGSNGRRVVDLTDVRVAVTG